MTAKRNRINGVRKEGELQKILEENGIFSLSLAPNIAGDIILPNQKVVIEVKSTKQYFSPFATEKLLSYNEQELTTYYAIFFNFKKEWKFFQTPLERTRYEEGLDIKQFIEKISINFK